MNAFLCYSALALLLNEVYFVLCRKRLDTNFRNKDVSSVRALDLLYYTLRAFSFVWQILILFFAPKIIALCFVTTLLSKFVLYHIRERTYRKLVLLLPFIHIILYGMTFWITR